MDSPLRELRKSYPRTRPPLSEAHRARYLLDYEENRGGRTAVTSIAQKLEAWMHRKVAAQGRSGEHILELGAGTLNHVPYERGYAVYDFVEPFIELWQTAEHGAGIGNAYRDIAEIPNNAAYDRIISVAVLEHLTDLPAVLARCTRLLKPGGLFQAGIPSEGGLFWGLAWRGVTGPAYRLRTGLDYGTLMRHEHVNNASDIIALIGYFFRRISISRFPLPLHHLSFYSYIEARDPVIERAEPYLGSSAETAP